ncbi:MAG: diaminopimelate decarboxylase family protein [Chloroflexota bacterium]
MTEDRLPAVAESLRAAARRFGTPVFVTDLATIDAAAASLAAAFPDPWVRQYSVKANDVAAVIAAACSTAVDRHALGANVVSRGEWAAASRAGVPNRRITLEGIGKTDQDVRAAADAARRGDPLLWVAVESSDELAALAASADRHRPVDVLLRLNPDVAPETHESLAVGRGGSKFGLTETELTEAVDAFADAPGLRLRGIHVHVGSQLGAVDAWRDGVRRALALVALVRGGVDAFDTLDVGGGFAVAPFGDAAPEPERFARELPPLIDALPVDRRPRRLAIEPGRYLVGRAGWLVGRVLHVRDRGRRQVVLDTGMTELIRPALYGARHEVVALTSLRAAIDHAARLPGPGADDAAAADVHGPICESTDALGEHLLPPLRRGDLVAIREAGAYAASLGSTYNGRPRPPQVLLGPDGELALGRRRGSAAALG